MADTNTQPSGQDTADETSVPRIRLGEIGFSALKVRNGHIYEETNTQFQMPYLAKVVSSMSYSPAVSIGLGAINTLISRSEVAVEPLTGETPEEKTRREYLFSVLHDMENSFQSTLQNIATSKEWGHQVSEMVFRRRLLKNGSRFNDGLVGLSKLAHRPQSTIEKWNYDETGRKLVSISQNISNVENSYLFKDRADVNGYIVIPREKFLLFRSDATSDNPLGASCLKSCYLAWKQLTLLEEHMMRGVAKDTSGIPFAQIPMEYMASNASDTKKDFYTSVKTILDNMADGVSKNIVLPSHIDEKGNELFKLQLLEQKSGKSYDLPLIIRQLQANILSVLSADSITMGADKSGSMSLQDSDTNMLALRVSFLLSQYADTMNQSLVPLLWKMNGWSIERLPKIKFKDISSVSLEEFSKAVQRLASTNCLEMSRANMNKINEVMGFEVRPDNEKVNPDNFPGVMAEMSSMSGEGLKSGVGEGTRKNAFGNKDASTQNNDNKG